MSSHKLKPISSVLEDLFNNKESVFSNIYFLYQLNTCWLKLVGSEIFKTVKPVKFQNKTLTLHVSDSSCMQEMHFAKDLIKDKINKHFLSKKIKKINLRIYKK